MLSSGVTAKALLPYCTLASSGAPSLPRWSASRPCTGETKLRFLFEQIAEGIEDFRAILEEVRDLPRDQVLAVARYEGRGIASGTEVRMAAAAIWRFEANQIVFFQDFATRDEALEAAGRVK
jgi:ketosteroid isomerase-like protein